MKRFLIGACGKIGRFFWSWGFLKFVLWTITLIIFLYVEEDWRGARAWAATKAEWEAKGESFDYNKLIPPPIPDDQNLAAISLFKLEPWSKTDSNLGPVALLHATTRQPGFHGPDLPSTGGWVRGELPDMAKMRNVIAADYAAAFKGATPPGDSLAQFDALYPFITNLLAASATHPLCRFDSDYTIYPPASRGLALLTQQIQVSKILTLHALLALDQHQSDIALEDIQTNYTLLSGAKRDPTLIGGLVGIGMANITHAAICDGLTLHAWNDAQLAELEQTLEPVNFLADYQFDMRCEAAESIANIDYVKSATQSQMYGYLFGMYESPSPAPWNRFPSLWPRGWWDQNKSQGVTRVLNALPCIDPQAQRVFPEVVNKLRLQLQRENARLFDLAPWKILSIIQVSWVPEEPLKFAYAQVWVDEARIACALERYRLAHGAYPDSLDALAPACIDALPHDIMTGDPYHYQLRADGTFLLYSVGWNETDDGGTVVYEKDNPTRLDYQQGDWVWPTPK